MDEAGGLDRDVRDAPAELFEREGELAAVEAFLDRGADDGASLLIEGPPGDRQDRAAAATRRGEPRSATSGCCGRAARRSSATSASASSASSSGRCCAASPPTIEPRSSPARPPSPRRSSASPTPATLDLSPAEASLYGLFWLVAGLAEAGPLVLAIDDAHWCDVASLRFVRYLGRRLDGLPLAVAIAARADEPGPGAEL